MPAQRQVAAGTIRYQISFVPNPEYRGGRGDDLYSDELRAEIRRRNVPEWKVVHFDGHRARTETVDADYGVRSPSFELRSSGGEVVTYCKQFPHFGFCVEHPIDRPAGGPPPHLKPSGEVATIAGFRCQKAEYLGSRHLLVWYTDEVAVNDPTGAVLSLEGVPGLVLQTQEVPASAATDAVMRVTVAELSSAPPAPEIFSPPVNYRRFATLDDARAEDRRMLDESSAKASKGIGPEDDAEFAGRWVFATSKDRIVVEITAEGGGEFRFRTTVETAPAHAAGRMTVEKAYRKGRLLMVDDPPNDRLYELSDGGRTMTLVGNELFSFTRV